MPELSERQQREKEYYDQFSSNFDINKKIDMAPIHGPIQATEKRPWNSYWAIYEFAIRDFRKGNIVLDFGSGPGENALRFSEIGYFVEGFDISKNNVFTANKLFQHHRRTDQCNFQVGVAESLKYPNGYFQTIIGIDILHHIDIPTSIKECHRVLQKGGKAYFREPIEIKFLDWIRRTKLVRFFAPVEKSFELHITEDERKLNSKDFQDIKSIFKNIKCHRYLLFSRFDKFFRDGADPKPSILERLDHFLFILIPGLKYLGGVVILELTKE